MPAIPNHTIRFTEPVICAKPGRTLLLKLSVALLALIGVPAVGVLIWGEVTGFNLNHLPVLPRVALAAAAVACAFGILSSVREAQVDVVLSCYRDRLTLTWQDRPALWSPRTGTKEVEVLYKDVKQCIFARSRFRLTLDTRGYRQRMDGGDWVKKTGAVHFSTLGAGETDFGALMERHTGLRVIAKQ